MSDYYNDALQAKQKLAKISDSFCLAKWKQVSLHLTQDTLIVVNHSSLHKNTQLHNPLLNNPSALHNTKHKKTKSQRDDARCKMSDCNYCWNIEAQNNISDRHYPGGELGQWKVLMKLLLILTQI